MTTPLCCRPGCPHQHENWFDATTTGHLCQEHWEAQCSREWLTMFHRLARHGVRGVLV
jgi:hypothetical protein